MRIALPIWQDRISPVFDVAKQLLLVRWADGREAGREEHLMNETAPDEYARRLIELGVETLICAGISQSLETVLADRGIRVIARVCGGIEEVLAAFQTGQLSEERFAMPGCCGQRNRRYRGGCGRRWKPDR
jgi:predicted Fe-Mo cluster-binding NifX family protein